MMFPKRLFFLLILFNFSAALATESKYIITAEQWAVPRSAEVLLSMPALKKAIQHMQSFPGSRLLIRYPGGDEGALWHSELRSWLVSLGLSSGLIESTPGSEANQLELEVIPPVADVNHQTR